MPEASNVYSKDVTCERATPAGPPDKPKAGRGRIPPPKATGYKHENPPGLWGMKKKKKKLVFYRFHQRVKPV
jgi:hypothetical protein